MRKTISSIMIFLIFTFQLIAQSSSSTDSFEDLFEQEEIVEEIKEEEEVEKPEEKLLITEKVELGGSFSSSYTSTWEWHERYPTLKELKDLDDAYFTINLGGSLFFDARPFSNFRVFGKAKALYPFHSYAKTPQEQTTLVNNIRIFELFSDFNWKDILFFRAGKHTIKWGVGYYFSPADVLNLTPIDPEEPEAEREGPVSLKAHLPLGVFNSYLYIIANDITRPWELAVAPRAEVVIGGMEAGIGLFYRYEMAPRGTITLTGYIKDFDLFAEGVVSYGSDKTFIKETDDSTSWPDGIDTCKREEEWFLSGTLGIKFYRSDWDLFASAQYLFNGEGYSNEELLKNPGIAILLSQDRLSARDLERPGMHYGVGSVNWKILKSDFSIGAFWIGNLSDFSGRIVPSLSWSPLDYASLSFSVPVVYGEEGDEFSPLGKGLSLTLEANLGSGKF